MQAVQDLGWANGWNEDPKIVVKCKQRGHVPEDRRLRAFGHSFGHAQEVRCDECGYKYKYDSS